MDEWGLAPGGSHQTKLPEPKQQSNNPQGWRKTMVSQTMWSKTIPRNNQNGREEQSKIVENNHEIVKNNHKFDLKIPFGNCRFIFSLEVTEMDLILDKQGKDTNFDARGVVWPDSKNSPVAQRNRRGDIFLFLRVTGSTRTTPTTNS